MSIEALFTVKLTKSVSLVDRFKLIYSFTSNDDAYGYATEVSYRHDPSDYINYDFKIDMHVTKGQPITQDMFWDKLKEIEGREDFIIKYRLVARNRYDFEETADDVLVVKTGYGLTFEIPGRDFVYHTVKGEDFDFVYDCWRSRYMRKTINGEPSYQAVLDEFVKMIETLGVQKIRGLDLEYSTVPSDCHLCYHSSPEGYLQDLRKLYPEKEIRELKWDDILSAIFLTNSVEVREVKGVPIVWHQEQIQGNLREFYHNLLTQITL